MNFRKRVNRDTLLDTCVIPLKHRGGVWVDIGKIRWENDKSLIDGSQRGILSRLVHTVGGCWESSGPSELCAQSCPGGISLNMWMKTERMAVQ